MASSLTAAFMRGCTIVGTSRTFSHQLNTNTSRLSRSLSYCSVQKESDGKRLCTDSKRTTKLFTPISTRNIFTVSKTDRPNGVMRRFDMHSSTPPSSISNLPSLASIMTTTSPHHLHPQNNPLATTGGRRRTMATQKHKNVIKKAKGYRGRANRTFRAAIRRVEKGMQYAYRDRKVKKREFRKLWIERVNAGVRQHGMSYSRLIDSMNKIGGREMVENGKEEGIIINRKMLAELAGTEPFSFKAVVDVVKARSQALNESAEVGEDWQREDVA